MNKKIKEVDLLVIPLVFIILFFIMMGCSSTRHILVYFLFSTEPDFFSDELKSNLGDCTILTGEDYYSCIIHNAKFERNLNHCFMIRDNNTRFFDCVTELAIYEDNPHHCNLIDRNLGAFSDCTISMVKLRNDTNLCNLLGLGTSRYNLCIGNFTF